MRQITRYKVNTTGNAGESPEIGWDSNPRSGCGMKKMIISRESGTDGHPKIRVCIDWPKTTNLETKWNGNPVKSFWHVKIFIPLYTNLLLINISAYYLGGHGFVYTRLVRSIDASNDFDLSTNPTSCFRTGFVPVTDLKGWTMGGSFPPLEIFSLLINIIRSGDGRCIRIITRG